MKVTKKVTTTVIGLVTNSGVITTTNYKDFNGGKHARHIFRERQKNGEKVFIDSVKTEKCVVELDDSIVFEEATFKTVKEDN